MREHLANKQQTQKEAFQKNIKDPNWKGKLTKSGRIYFNEEITPTEILKIKEKIKAKGFPTTYYLDGIASDESTLDIPANELEKIEFHELRYRKFDTNGKFTHATPWNFEVKVKRKGKDEKFLIHAEVQSSHDPNFLERMFDYYYLFKNKEKLPVESIAIYTDNYVHSQFNHYSNQYINT